MRRASTRYAAIGILITLAGCGTVDAGATFFPAALRDKGPTPPAPDSAPDVRAALQGQISAVFMAAAAPTNVSFSPPKPSFAEWMTCVKASVSGATGRAIGTQTYLVNIDHGQISRRERVDARHWCANEHYQSL
jgi:hypothetical protein